MKQSTKALLLAALILIIAGASGIAYSELTGTRASIQARVSWALLLGGIIVTFVLAAQTNFLTRFDKWAREHGGIVIHSFFTSHSLPCLLSS
jgi:hypothetical protein